MVSSSGEDDVGKDLHLAEKIMFFIPSFKGYKEKKLRREDDKLIRYSVTDNLEKAEKEFREALTLLSTPVSKDIMTLVDIINYRISRLKDMVKIGKEDYTWFFDYEKINENLLNKIMFRDLKLLEISKKVSNDIIDLSKKGFTDLDVRNRLLMIIESLKVLEDNWTNRLKLLKSMNKML